MNGPVAWCARNGVVGNLLLFVIVAAGALSIAGLNSTLFPDVTLDVVTVSVPYRGASPPDVEESVCVLVEEALQGIEGVNKITSTADEGVGVAVVEVRSGYDIDEIREEIKSKVDGIEAFPEDAGRPVVRSIPLRVEVIGVVLYGAADLPTLKRIGEQARRDLEALPEISQVEMANVPPYEISIEVSEQAMRRWDLTFDDVAAAVRRSSVDLPGGSVKTPGGEIMLRTSGRADTGDQFEALPVVRRPDGTMIRVGDVAQVVDGFEEIASSTALDGTPAVVLNVYRVGNESATDIADAVYAYVQGASASLPDGINMAAWQDWAYTLRSRTRLLVENALSGLLLVFVVLALFMRLRLALWVAIGIPVSFMGAFALMPAFDVTINMISLLAFILVLGIVVDDAIVVAENIDSKQAKLKHGVKGAIEGTREVCVPVVFGVLTTMVSFAPMFFVPGTQGKLMVAIPLIVIPVLFFSLVESIFVLPGHLAHRPSDDDGSRGLVVRAWDRLSDRFSTSLEWIARELYRPVLRAALHWRYLTLAIALTCMAVTGAFVASGRIKVILLPTDESDKVVAFVTMPQEAPVQATRAAVERVEQAAFALREEIAREEGSDQFRHILSSIGEQPYQLVLGGPTARINPPKGEHLAEVNIELKRAETRTVRAEEIARRLRERIGRIPGASELSITHALFGGGKAIDIQFNGADLEEMQAVVNKTKERLEQYPGVFDVTDTSRGAKPEIQLSLAPEGETMGLSLIEIGRQVRQGFFGEEVQRIQRGREDVRVMVRYPETERRSVGDLEGMRFRVPGGDDVPFSTVAEATLGRGPASITRVDRNRSINVLAAVDSSVTTSQQVLADLETTFLPGLLENHDSVRYAFLGDQAELIEATEALAAALAIALCVMFVTLAVPLKSYVAPVIVLSAVPFGAVGAIWGHVIMGIPLTFISTCGVVALAGVVVNDSLVLVSFVQDHAGRTASRFEAVRIAGESRFRAIILTSLTTTAGVSPLMFESDLQAQFLIPMAVALAYGVLFATLVTLLLVPALYLILDDFRLAVRWCLHGNAEKDPNGGSSRSVPE